MYFRNIHCPICNHEHDPMDPECPNCHNKNSYNKRAAARPFVKQVNWIRQLILFLVGWIGFQIVASVFSLVIGLTDLDTMVQTAILNFGTYFMLFIGMGLIVWTDWKKVLPSFKQGYRPYLFGVIGFATMMMFSILWQTFLFEVGIETTTNTNETTAESIVSLYPFLSLIVIGTMGPICEELTYRVGLYGFLKRWNRIWAFIITTIVFAFIHFDFSSIITAIQGDNSVLINELLNIPYYLFAGATFTFLYSKFGFAGSMVAHVTNNVFSVIMTIASSSIVLSIL